MKSVRSGPLRRRRGFGLLAVLALGFAVVLGISIVSTGGRGILFGGDSGFLHRPSAPLGSERQLPASEPSALEAPKGPELSKLHAELIAAKSALQAGIERGDASQLGALREGVASAEARHSQALASQ